MKKHVNKNAITYMLDVAVCLTVCLFVFVKRELYPFGENTIFSWDGYQGTGPICYYIWDIINSRTSLIFSWKIAAGADMSCVNNLISPLNLFYFLVKRTMVPYIQHYFFAIRIVLAALSFQFFLNCAIKRKKDILISIFCSTAYAMSIWSFKFANLPYFLDAAFYVPLLCAFLIKIFEEERCKKRYAVVLAMTMLSGVQPAYIALLFLFLFAGTYLFLNFDKKQWSRKVFLLGVYTLLGIGTSAILFLPMAVGAVTSGRIAGGSFFHDFWTMAAADEAAGEKLQFVSGLTGVLIIINILFFLFRLFRGKKGAGGKVNSAFVLMILMLLPVVSEGIHLIWQGGKYVAFPLRGGYSIYFSVIYCFAASVSERISYAKNELTLSYFLPPHIKHGLAVIFAAIAVFLCIGVSGYENAMRYLPGQMISENDGLYSQGEALFEQWGGNIPVTERFKILDATLYHNYGLIAGIPVIGNYIHLLPGRALATNRGLGYAQDYTRLSDAGGTAFSDALLGYRYTLSRTRELDSLLYAKQDVIGDLSVYKNQYIFPFGFLLNRGYEDIWQEMPDMPFQNQNWIAENVLGEKVLQVEEYPLHSGEIFMKAEYDCALYIYRKDMDFSGMLNRLQFMVNGEPVLCPTYLDLENPYYATFFNDGILYLGTFRQGEEIEIEYEVENEGNFELAICDLELLKDKVPEDVIKEISFFSHSADIQTIDLTEPALLYLPISNIKGWRAEVNGKSVDIKTVFGDYMAIPVEKGENSIELRFWPPGFWLGCVVSVCAISVLLGLNLFEKKNIVPGRLICLEKLFYHIYLIICIGLFLLYLVFIGIKLYSVYQWVSIRIYWRIVDSGLAGIFFKK